jgi:exodeoxyribonuclease V gamma subunit
MLKLLERILTQGDRGTGHQTGRATFCAMMPMRSIPFRVIALLGMDDGAFPRNPPALGFDLVEQHPRLGDTHPRDEDRYLLLETLLCAQDHLIITWSNRNPCTGKPTPPAVPIGELLDVVDRSLGHAAGPAREVLLREHPLHPFTSRAFGRGEHGEVIAPWSMDPDVLRAAQSLDGHPEPPAALLAGPIAAESLETEIELESLISCLRSPIQRLLRDRLQIRLWEDDSTPTDREELDHEGLRRWESGHALLQAWFQGGTTTDERSLQHARGQLPPGTIGTVAFGAVEEKALPILAAAQELEEGPAQQIIIDIEIEGVRIHGTVDRVFGDRRICAQYGTLRSKHQLDAWIRHLALCVALPERDIITSLVTPHTYKKNEAQQIHLQLSAPEPTARELLGQLITLYHRASHEPLQIFCESGLHYANSRERGHPRSLAISTANKGWDYDLYSEYLQHAFGSSPRLSEIADSGNFASLSEEVFGPLIRAGAKPMTSSGKKR